MTTQGRYRVADRHAWEDRSVGDPQPFQAMDGQLPVDDRHFVAAHLLAADDHGVDNLVRDSLGPGHGLEDP